MFKTAGPEARIIHQGPSQQVERSFHPLQNLSRSEHALLWALSSLPWNVRVLSVYSHYHDVFSLSSTEFPLRHERAGVLVPRHRGAQGGDNPISLRQAKQALQSRPPEYGLVWA